MSNKVSFIFVAQDRYNKIAAKINRTTEKMRKIVLRTVPAMTKLSNRMALLRKNAVGFGKGMQSAGARLSVFATLPILLLGRSMKNAARDAEETQTKFDTVFKKMQVKANTTADVLAKNYGLAGSQAQKLLGDTGDLLTGFGFTQTSALKLSKDVQELAVDLASFTNFSGGAEGASAALTKALLGERESVKSLGISILETDVKRKVQILLAKGMTFATMRQAKAFATLQLAQEQSKNAIGDFKRTQGGLANQERILAARTLDLSEKFGKILVPIMLEVTQTLIKVADWFGKLSPATKKTILIVLALTAVVGPLLLALGSLAAAIAFIGGPITLIIIGVSALIAAFIALKTNWLDVSNAIGGTIEQIGINFNLIVDDIIAKIDLLLGKALEFVLLPTKLAKAGLDFIGLGDDPDVNINKRSEAIVAGGAKNQTDVNVNLNAPQNTINSVKSRTTGKPNGLNVGVNMALAQ